MKAMLRFIPAERVPRRQRFQTGGGSVAADRASTSIRGELLEWTAQSR
jgi:hypothetical protein